MEGTASQLQERNYTSLDDVTPAHHDVGYNRLPQVEQRFMMTTCFDDDFLKKFSKINKTVLAATDRRAGHTWCGLVWAFCGRVASGALDIVRVEDMDMSNLSGLAAYMIWYLASPSSLSKLEGSKVECLKMFCEGDRQVRSKVILVPRLHPVFTSGAVSQISTRRYLA